MTETQGAQDRAHMARALALAARGLYTTDPNPRVGCVLVRAGNTLGEGWHERAGEAHAEVVALRAARGDARGATAYVTLEPCSHTGRTPPCVDALIAAGIRRVVCSSVDPNPKVAGSGIKRLEAAGIDVSVGALEREARALNPGFFSRFERGRPWIRLKLAMSLDARTAPARGEEPGGSRRAPRWISGETSRADVQHWRARSSCVLTGAGTVRADDPRLDVRLAYGDWVRQPLRVLLDPALTCAPESRIFAGGHALVFAAQQAAPPTTPSLTATPNAPPTPTPTPTPMPTPISTATSALAAHPAAAAASPAPHAVERVPADAHRLDLNAVVARLTEREVNEILVECGPRLAGAFIEAQLVDELIIYMAPILLGADAPPLTALTGLRGGDLPAPGAGARGEAAQDKRQRAEGSPDEAAQDALARFEIASVERMDMDLRLVLTPRRGAPCDPASCAATPTAPASAVLNS
jgi:diaminohydroxyphosphoribosylaminopyrimidine deaminase/5-amino-6-(5-phosphoribosylamino)uracil reductase